MFVALVIRHAKGKGLITLSSGLVWIYHIFPYYLISSIIFVESITGLKMCVSIFVKSITGLKMCVLIFVRSITGLKMF